MPQQYGKLIDAREGRGDLVLLGKALVLPSSTEDGDHIPLDGSLRFHDETFMPQVFKEGAWHTLGTGGASGGGNTLAIDQFTVVGRDRDGVGEPHQIDIGAGLYFADGVLRMTTAGGSGKLVMNGSVQGKLNDNETIPLAISALPFTASEEYSYARARFPATEDSTIVIKKKTGQNAPVIMGFFNWLAGETEAQVVFLDPEIAELDFVHLEGPMAADATLADFTFVIRSGFAAIPRKPAPA